MEKAKKLQTKPKSQHIFDAKKKFFVENMIITRGNISKACKLSGISYQTYRCWLDKCPQLATALEQVGDDAVDFLQDCMFKEAENGNGQMIKLGLEAYGKHRGFNPTKDVTHHTGDLDSLQEIMSNAIKENESDY